METMKLASGSSRDGAFVKAYEPSWNRALPGGNYDEGWGFFDVHWETKDRDPGVIRLHVESPKQAMDADLSALKQRLIDAILTAGVRELAKRCGFGFTVGSRISRAALCKSTTVFKVAIPEGERGDHEHNLRVVHQAMGTRVDQVVTSFAAELGERFGPA